MALNATQTGLRTTPFRSADGRFPTWRFTSSILVVGDASGGDVTMSFILRLANQPPSGLVYGLRSIWFRGDLDVGAVGAHCDNFRMDANQSTDDAISFFMPKAVPTATRQLNQAINQDTVLGLATGGNNNSSVVIGVETNTNTANYRGYLEGFIWTPEALYQGGPLFPGEFPTP